MNCATPVIVLFSLLAALVSVQTDLDRQNEAAHDFWDELTEGTGKAENYGHWERIVRRSDSNWYDPSYRH